MQVSLTRTRITRREVRASREAQAKPSCPVCPWLAGDLWRTFALLSRDDSLPGEWLASPKLLKLNSSSLFSLAHC